MPRLLNADEPSPIIEERREGGSPFVVVVDHASARVPHALDGLGLPGYELTRHIASDIGAYGVATRLAAALDATLVAQAYSRLVIDCNRDPRSASSIPAVSELTEIPGNMDLPAGEAAARAEEIFEPYHEHLRGLIDARLAAGRTTILIALHSMTDVFRGVRRTVHAAVLAGRDRRFSDFVLAGLRQDGALSVGDNEPYSLSDLSDYTLPRHAWVRNLPHVELEIRQDLVREEAGQIQWAQRLAGVLRAAQDSFLAAYPPPPPPPPPAPEPEVPTA